MNIAILGYGIQGRAQALNLRDSGFNIVIGNIDDNYKSIALKDGMHVRTIADAVKTSDVILVLLPDSIQDHLLRTIILPNTKKNSCLVFAHGYWLTYESKTFPVDLDLIMIAPRFPGEQIRERFLKGSGVPAYIDIASDITGNANLIIQTLSKGLGFDKGGVIKLPYKMEAELDLMIEQSMAPIFFASVQSVFNELISRGYPEEAVCLELYFSGELGAVRSMMGRDGLYSAFQNNASPTCQYGIASSISRVWSKEMDKIITAQLDRIVSGKFANEMRELDTIKLTKDFLQSPIALKIKNAENSVRRKIKK
jgi:ketol-acid reductoisomerase